ncbi:MAG: nucleotide exchange factor GrpE [Patescibacteria group bacterium]
MTNDKGNAPHSDTSNNNLDENLESAVGVEAQDEESPSVPEAFNLKVIQAELEDWKEKSLRLAADLQNLNKQHELDIQQVKKSTKKTILMPVVSFIGVLNLAFTFTPETKDDKTTKFIDTLKSSLQKVIDDFKTYGVEVIIPEVGEEFNAEYMNILNPNSVDQDQQVLVKQIVSCGLKIDNQLIQPVSIMV